MCLPEKKNFDSFVFTNNLAKLYVVMFVTNVMLSVSNKKY